MPPPLTDLALSPEVAPQPQTVCAQARSNGASSACQQVQQPLCYGQVPHGDRRAVAMLSGRSLLRWAGPAVLLPGPEGGVQAGAQEAASQEVSTLTLGFPVIDGSQPCL